ncbi:hypothetical protein GOP47_0009395, partial [Adiantum capillus-veneris]
SQNEEAHGAAQASIGQLYVIRADSPLYLGREALEREEEFLQTGGPKPKLLSTSR